MASSKAAAVLRGDINTVVMEAANTDSLFIGDKVLPVYLSDTKTGQYPKFTLRTGNLLNNDATLRSPRGEYGKVIRQYTTDTFTCVDRGLEEAVDDSEKRDVSRYFDAEAVAALDVLRQVRIAHEVRAASTLINASTFTATAAAVNYTEANIATIAFHADVLAAVRRLEAKGVMANSIVLSSSVFDRVRRSTLAQNFIRGAGMASDSRQMLTAGDLASSFADVGISNVFVGRLNYNSAKQGQPFSATPVWGNTYFWVGNIQGGDFMNGGAGRTIVWNEEGGLFVTETYRDEKIRSDMVRVRQNTAEKITDATAGELVTTSYS